MLFFFFLLFSLTAFMADFPSGAAWAATSNSASDARRTISDFIFSPQTNQPTEKLQILSSFLFSQTLNTKASWAFPTRGESGGAGWSGGGVAAKCEAACRAKSRQALCKANTASRRLVLVSGRLVSLALFIVSATRHLLETRLCPPVSTQHRTEGACQHCPSTSPLLPFPRQSVFPS